MLLDDIHNYISQIEPLELSSQQIFSLVDLTSLNDNDTEQDIKNLCAKAVADYGHAAAVCIYPEFVSIAAAYLKHSPVKVATVANFPEGEDYLQDVLISLQQSIAHGAKEIDVVFPYGHYLEGERSLARDFVAQCKKACGSKALLKIILETGAIGKPMLIADAAKLTIEAGADFIKTSTGKIDVGASLEAAAAMLLMIKDSGKQCGLKVSGGVRSVIHAAEYISLAEKIMGKSWVSPQRFRIGASRVFWE